MAGDGAPGVIVKVELQRPDERWDGEVYTIRYTRGEDVTFTFMRAGFNVAPGRLSARRVSRFIPTPP